MNDDIARLYADRGVVGVRPRFSMALIRLHHLGPMTIRALAHEVDVSHSAMSQTITVMRREGLVSAGAGDDARTRLVSLTALGRELVPLLEAEWRATESALAELDAQVPYPLARVVADLAEALAHRSFYDRVVAHLDPSTDAE
ncbi:winged helix DNA-binding protein [Natronosporangium hydrolyticum]|uniref:Winged helix DNA-binding protein n=2 Tax=Natronosporangium hydrolyticum TaxID=2811111 RepID=A0A895YPD8_9ACTN|nr:winged helix DNA-binding protein [Natronosporangium hydrolyticum]